MFALCKSLKINCR